MYDSTVIRFGLALAVFGLLAACGQQPAPATAPTQGSATSGPASAEAARTEPAPAGPHGAAPSFTLTNADADRALRLQRGQVVEVRLTADRVSGFTWIPKHDVRPMMSPDGMPQYEVDEDTGPGAPGTEVWRFVAREPGHVHLAFDYRRPFETNAAPAQTIVYHFDIE